ncbi:MAG: helix-turn-helix domain-containing protein [Leptospirales bacterium]|nr:helix-turn-helix domain-containing protein [Leptospirales bacterium]
MRFDGTAVKRLREEKNWTQLEVARRLAATGKFRGHTRQRIHQIESGNHASARTICALCEVFEVSPNLFFVEN